MHTVAQRPASSGRLPIVLRAGAAMLVAAVLGGCGVFGSGPPRYVPVPLAKNFTNKMAVSRAWEVSVGNKAGVGFVPAVVGDSIYAATENGEVGKYDLATGKVIWRVSAKTSLSAGVGSNGRITAVASPRGEVIAFDDSGKVKWRAQATSEVTVPPLVGDNLVVIRSGDYKVQAFDADTGSRRWSVQRPGPALALRAADQMLLSNNFIFTGLPGGKVIAIASATGAVRWEGTVANPSGTSELERVADVVGMPVIAGRLMCAVTYQGRISCFDVSSGDPTWSRPFSSTTGMTADLRFAYAPDAHGTVNGFALDSGANVWKQAALANRSLSAPVIIGGAVALGDYQGYVHFLSPDDGTLLARIETDGSPIATQPVVTTRGLLVQTSKGRLYLINAGQ